LVLSGDHGAYVSFQVNTYFFPWPALSLFSCNIIICNVGSIVLESAFNPT
jgi:hypothetical protein